MKYDLAGAHVINKFVWDGLKSELSMATEQYMGLVPIIPTQQIAVFNDMGANKPFIVYTYAQMSQSTDIWENIEQMVYTVYSDNESQLRQITNFLRDLLKRYDLTAEELNDFIQGADTPLDSDDKQFSFKWVTTVSGIGPEPYATEGGRQGSSLTLRYCYTQEEKERSRRV